MGDAAKAAPNRIGGWDPAATAQQALQARQVREIKVYLSKGFQPIDTHLPKMEIDLENGMLAPHVPKQLMVVQLPWEYNANLILQVVVELVHPWLEHKELLPEQSGICVVNSGDKKRWLVMPFELSYELMNNLKASKGFSGFSALQ